ncbi:hypothetical protein HYC85_007869 [Camellia sinensis]|uniref:Uncharacterized protein n=1 Tax=Camellia sinensis TaxID=4442 RepID=A0A7J7HQ90_CAMSI|nr:hypothetical protein HYC85_007869 [Camellia sinensis]
MEEEEAPLVAENLETQTLTKKNHTRDVHILSSAFLLMFLAYGAVQNLESTINTVRGRYRDNFARDIVFVFYGFFFLCFIGGSVPGYKNALVLETAGYWLFIAVNLKPTWYMTVSASLYLGFSASIIWVAEVQSIRIHILLLQHAVMHMIGNFNGEFWGMFAGHKVLHFGVW